MRTLGRRTFAVVLGRSVLFRRDRVGSAFGARYLRPMGFLAALVMASQAGAEDVVFFGPFGFEAGNDPRSVAVADLDGDDVPDLVTANFLSDDVSVLLANVLANEEEWEEEDDFQAAVSFEAGNGPRSVAVAYLDDNDFPDLVTANFYSDDVSVLLGDGLGSFQAADFPAPAAGNGPFSIAVADFDGDSFSDLVTANELSDDVSVLLGNGDGSFQVAASFAVGNGPRSVAVADLNGDNVPDLVTANFLGDDVSVLLGNEEDGEEEDDFQAPVSFEVGHRPVFVAVADLDDDGVPDLVTANSYSDDVSVLLGNGDGSLRPSPARRLFRHRLRHPRPHQPRHRPPNPRPRQPRHPRPHQPRHRPPHPRPGQPPPSPARRAMAPSSSPWPTSTMTASSTSLSPISSATT